MTPREIICDFDNLYEAMHKCKRGVQWKDSVAGWVRNGVENCRVLREQLITGKYHISRYDVFEITEPKRRVIVATKFRDRVFQRSMCDNYLTQEVTRHFIYDNGACLQYKGTDFARNRLKVWLQRYYRKHGADGYVLKIDIKNYFGSTRHDVLCAVMRDYIRDDWVYGKVCDIINSFTHGEDPEVGVGLGSQVSQIMQLALLDRIDHMIKEKLHIRGYVRYMDDLILIHKDKGYLHVCLETIRAELEKLQLKINDRKTQIFKISQGVKFLGFSYRLTETGRIEIRILPEKLTREKRRLRKQVNIADRETVDQWFQAWKAHAAKAKSYYVIEDMQNYYEGLWREKNGRGHQNPEPDGNGPASQERTA